MRYKQRNDISNVRRAETDDLDHLVRNINIRVAEESNEQKPKQEEHNKPHVVEHSMTAKVIGRAIEGAVVGAMLVGFGIASKDIVISTYKSVQRTMEIPKTISEEMTRPYQATGIVVTSGKRTDDVFGTIYLDSADGTSYYYKNGKPASNYVPSMHQFSIPLSTYIKVVSTNGDQTLFVQNILEVSRSYSHSIVYLNTSEIYKLPSTSILNAVERGVQDAFAKLPPVNNPTHLMRGKGYQGYYGHKRWNIYYVYNKYAQELEFPVGIGLDITAKKDGDDLVIKFGQFPAENGMLYREKMHVFDKVTYHVKGLENAYMIFNNKESTGLTISGYGNNDVVKSKNLEGVLSLYEMNNKKVEPLIMSGTKEWAVNGGSYNVRAEGTGNYVIVTTAPSKKK